MTRPPADTQTSSNVPDGNRAVRDYPEQVRAEGGEQRLGPWWIAYITEPAKGWFERRGNDFKWRAPAGGETHHIEILPIEAETGRLVPDVPITVGDLRSLRERRSSSRRFALERENVHEDKRSIALGTQSQALMTPGPLATKATSPAPVAAELLLALASELHAVDTARVDRVLDWVAEPLRRFGGTASAPVAADDLLAVLQNSAAAGGDGPETLVLNATISRRPGHPISLAVTIQEAARRAGLPLVVLGGKRTWAVGDVRFHPAVLVDRGRRTAWPPPSSAPERLRPWCTRQVAFAVSARLVAAYAFRGDMGRAIRAAELRLKLPIEGSLRQVTLERDRLRACLN